jgi:hypothetical protein
MYCRKCKRESFEVKTNEYYIPSLLEYLDSLLNEKEYEKNAIFMNNLNLCSEDDKNVDNGGYINLRCFKNSVNIFQDLNNTNIITMDELTKIINTCMTEMTLEEFKNVKIDKKIYIIILLILIIFYVKM